MANQTERDNLKSLGKTKKFNVFGHNNAVGTADGYGTFFVQSMDGKPFKANMDLTAATAYLNSF